MTLRDELERELRRRDNILEAARIAAERFLSGSGSWRAELPEVLAELGKAAEVSRVWASENFEDAEGLLRSRQISEWNAEGVSPQGDDPQLAAFPYLAGGFGRWVRTLGAGEIIAGHVRDFPAAEQALFVPQSVLSMVAVPIFVGTDWWGIVGFDECDRERSWSSAELAALRTASRMIGVAARLERVTQQLRERETQYQQVFEASTDGLVITDRDGTFVAANPAFHAMHRYSAGELDGRRADTWTHPEHLAAVTGFLAEASTAPRSSLEAYHVRRDGTPFPVELNGTSFQFRGRPHLLSVVRDVTERVQATQLLERRVSALGAVAANLVLDQPIEATLREMVRIVVEAGSGVAAVLRILDPRSGRLSSLATYGLPDGYEEMLRTSPESGLAPAVEPISHMPAGPAWDTPLSLPLDSLGRNLGGLQVFYPPGREPGLEEIAFLKAVANQAAVAVENDRLHRASRSAAALIERQRLARELHDSVSQALFSMTLHARTAQLAMSRQGLPPDGPLGRAVGQLRELTQGALAEMRALIFELRPGALAEEGLVAAVRKQAAALTAREGLPITVTGPDQPLGLPAETEEHVYRIVLEALHNTVKHAAASAVSVVVTSADGEVRIAVRDDGRGFDTSREYAGHLGLGTMRDRAAAIGAVLRLVSSPDAGTTVDLRLATVPRVAPGPTDASAALIEEAEL